MHASPSVRDCCTDCPARVVCRCLQVTEEKILESIATFGVRSLKDVKKTTGAGDGCTCCHRKILKLLETVEPTLIEV